MRRRRVQLGVAVVSLFCGLSLWAQQGSDASPSSISSSGVPRLASFSGVVRDASGKLKTGVVTLTFSLYAGQEGGTPLWSETQEVQADDTGHYTVLVGATAPNGLPLDLFTTGTARWLGVQPGLSGVGEQPRVLLVGMPYALKAADADTLGGKPASAFVMAESPSASGTTSSSAGSGVSTSTSQIVPILSPSLSAVAPATVPTPATSCTTITADGTAKANSMAKFTAPCVIRQSTALSESGGTVGVAGVLQLPSMGTATKTTGFNSQPHDWLASAFNSSTNKAVSQHFRWQAEPVNSNTSSPSGKFNLLFASGSGIPAETGVSIGANGQITAPLFTGNGSGLTNLTAASISGGTAGINITGSAATAMTAATATNALNLGGLAPSSYQPAGAYATLGANTFTGTQAVASSVNVDSSGANSGFLNNGLATGTGLTFGVSSGEGIASKRTSGGNQFGLDFYTAFSNRMSITQAGSLIVDSSHNNALSLNSSTVAGTGLIFGGAGSGWRLEVE